jgi:hypothetical protein
MAREAGIPNAHTMFLHYWVYPPELLPALAGLSPDVPARVKDLTERLARDHPTTQSDVAVHLTIALQIAPADAGALLTRLQVSLGVKRHPSHLVEFTMAPHIRTHELTEERRHSRRPPSRLGRAEIFSQEVHHQESRTHGSEERWKIREKERSRQEATAINP